MLCDTPPLADALDGINPLLLDIGEVLTLLELLLVVAHRTEDAADAMVAHIVQLAVRHLADFVQELPYIRLSPFNDG